MAQRAQRRKPEGHHTQFDAEAFPITAQQLRQQVIARGHEVQHRQQQAQRSQRAELLAPRTRRLAHEGMHQRHRPQREEDLQLALGAMPDAHRHQSVGPQVAHAGDGQSGDGRHVQRFDQPIDPRGRAAELAQMLLAALHDEQHRARTHHRGAREAAQKVEPLHRPAAEGDHVQPAHGRLREHGGPSVRGARQAHALHLAGGGRELHHAGGGAEPARGFVVAIPSVHADARSRVARVVDDDRAHRLAHALLAARREGFEHGHGHRAADGGGLVTVAQLGHETHLRLRAGAVVQDLGGRHEAGARDHEAGVGDHELEGQGQHRHGVVRVEPAALAFLGPEGEEVLEDALVRDDARHQRHQHRHRGDADDPQADGAGVQLVVEVDEVVTAERGARRVAAIFLQRLAGGGVERDARVLPVGVEPEHAQLAAALRVRRPQLPHRGARVVLGHVGHAPGQALRAVGRGFALSGCGGGFLGVVLWGHPVGDGLVEHGQRAGEEHREQQPREPQAAPGVQPGLGLAEAAL
ncbi:hypothetical protein D9M68_593250 [compost metagenome]